MVDGAHEDTPCRDLFCQMRTAATKRYFFYVGPLLIYASIIFILSSLSKQPEALSFFFDYDKLLHVAEYFVLGYLLMRVMTTSPRAAIARRAVMITIIVGLVYGLSDEWHQSFVPGRCSSVIDVLFDAVGVVVAAMTSERIRYKWPIIRHIETRIENIQV